jgi:hypothetical protein
MPGRVLGYMLEGLVRYGYRTWLAGIWLATFGHLVGSPSPCNRLHRATLLKRLGATPRCRPSICSYQLSTLVATAHWKLSGPSEYIGVLLILAGWVLTTAVVRRRHVGRRLQHRNRDRACHPCRQRLRFPRA